MSIELKLLALLLLTLSADYEPDCVEKGGHRVLVGWETVQLAPRKTARVPLYRCALWI